MGPVSRYIRDRLVASNAYGTIGIGCVYESETANWAALASSPEVD